MYEQEQESSTETQKGDSQGKIEQPCTESAGRKQAPKMNETDRGGDRSKDAISDYLSNLKKNFDKVKDDPKFIVEVVGIVAALAVIIIYVCQLHQMSQQSGAMKHQLEMTDRPWIKDSVVSAFEMGWQHGSYLGWAVTVRTENVGHSVATGIFPEVKLIAIEGADFIDSPRREAKTVCDDVDARFDKIKGDPIAWATSVFPEASLEFPQNVHLLPSEVEKKSFNGGVSLGKSVMPMLVGCIVYHYPSSEHAHHTGFVYLLSHSDDPALPEPTTVFFGIGKDIPKDKVILRKVGQFAD